MTFRVLVVTRGKDPPFTVRLFLITAFDPNGIIFISLISYILNTYYAFHKENNTAMEREGIILVLRGTQMSFKIYQRRFRCYAL